ncbi:MAG TPA: hypothetical protein V6C84_05145 [Coleofasciculaceae cyanobacterium]|jgi:hypothetical protein
MYDLANFSKTDMYDCAIALRNAGSGAKSMEEVASHIVDYLYKHCIDQQTGQSACALVRFFKTHPYGRLTEELQQAARTVVSNMPITPTTKCLTLLATAGEEPHWNSRNGSTGHKAIPLVDEGFVKRAPMISQLIQQFGLEVSAVIEPIPNLLIEAERKIHNTFIFHVPDALGSQHIPAQKEFVVPYGVRSVLGFGGLLPTGDLFIIILFMKTRVPQETADLFKWISASSWVAAATFDGEAVFKHK